MYLRCPQAYAASSELPRGGRPDAYGALSFGAGLLIGNLIWDDDSDCDWDNHHVYGGGGHNDVNINVDGDVNIGNQVNVGDRDRRPWQHNPAHRGGVQYRDPKTRQTFANQPGSRPALDRDAARGYNRDTLGSGGGLGKGSSGLSKTGSPSTKLGSGAGSKAPSAAKPPSPASRVASATKKPTPSPVAQKRPSSGIGSAGGNRPTAIGGLGGGAATRAASTRGASSRGSSSGAAKLGAGGKSAGGKIGGGGGKRR